MNITNNLSTLPEELYFDIIYNTEPTKLKDLCATNKRFSNYCNMNKIRIIKYYFKKYDVNYTNPDDFMYKLHDKNINDYKKEDGTFNFPKIFRLYITMKEIPNKHVNVKNVQSMPNYMPIYKNINTLTLMESSISKIPKLLSENLHRLNLYNVKSLQEISDMNSLYMLNCKGCPDLKSISNLQNLKNLLHINDCNNLTEFKNIYKHIEDVSIEKCYNLKSLSPIKKINNIMLYKTGITKLENISFDIGKIYKCHDLEILNDIIIYNLRIKECNALTIINNIHSVFKMKYKDVALLKITNCPNLIDLTDVMVLYLYISNCDKLKNVDKIVTQDLTIKNCESLITLQEIHNLKRLTLENTQNLRNIPEFKTLTHIECIGDCGVNIQEIKSKLKKLSYDISESD